MGKVLLAYRKVDPNAVSPLQPFTRRTIVDPQALDAELERVRTDGYAVNDGEQFDGVVAVSSPVLDRSGRVIAAIAVQAPRTPGQRDPPPGTSSAGPGFGSPHRRPCPFVRPLPTPHVRLTHASFRPQERSPSVTRRRPRGYSTPVRAAATPCGASKTVGVLNVE